MSCIISQGKVRLDASKIKKEYEKLDTIKQLRSFLRICDYLRPFIRNYVAISKPLNKLLRGETKSLCENNRMNKR